MGFEPTTCALRVRCSTPEPLQQDIYFKLTSQPLLAHIYVKVFYYHCQDGAGLQQENRDGKKGVLHLDAVTFEIGSS